MGTVLLVIHLLVAVFLVAVILLQRSEGGALDGLGGGSGAGVKISPVAFLVVKDGNVKLLTVNADKPLDKLVDAIPDIVNKLVETVDKTLLKPSGRLKIK